jgi:hypothetical protein
MAPFRLPARIGASTGISADTDLLPLTARAARHVARLFSASGAEAPASARAAASYALAMLGYGYHTRLSTHSVAMTAAQLLYVAGELESGGRGPALEPRHLPPAHDARALERAATRLGGPDAALTQEDVADALTRLRQAVALQDLDLAACLRAELGLMPFAFPPAGADIGFMPPAALRPAQARRPA